MILETILTDLQQQYIPAQTAIHTSRIRAYPSNFLRARCCDLVLRVHPTPHEEDLGCSRRNMPNDQCTVFFKIADSFLYLRRGLTGYRPYRRLWRGRMESETVAHTAANTNERRSTQ